MTKRAFVSAMAKVMNKKVRKIKVPALPFLILAHIGEKSAALLNYQLPLTQKLQFFLASRRYSIEKATKELKYYPKTGIELTIRKTFEWYKEEGYL